MNTPTIFLTNPFTGEYAGTELADEDPLVEGNWLLPAGAYFDAPPAVPAGFVQVRVGDNWEIQINKRGTTYWDAEGQQYTITELNVDVPEWGLLDAPPPTPAALSRAACVRRDAELLAVASRLSVLNYAVELNVADEEEVSEAQLLKYYSVLLSRVERQAGFPTDIEWPNLDTLTLPQPATDA